MPANALEMVMDLATHAGQVGISHLGKRLDATIPQPPQPPQWQPPAWTPPQFQGLGDPSPAPTPQEAPAPVPQTATDPAARTGQSYSDQVAQGVACLNCTRHHLSTVKTAAAEAAKAVDSGDDAEARRQWAIVAGELDALARYDWEPGKLAASPPEDQAIIEQVRACVSQARAQVGTPTSAALVYGSASESGRFAVSTRFTERDAAEIQARLREIDTRGNYAERAELSHDASPEATAAKEHLRNGRHVLDEAGTNGTLYRSETWTQASAHFEAAAVALTPTPTRAQAQALAETCTACAETFYQGYFAKQAQKKGMG